MKKWNRALIMSVGCVLLSAQAHSREVFEDFYEHMRYLAARDKVLSQNIQNVDTPGYLPDDLAKMRSKNDEVFLSKTHPSHLDLRESSGQFRRTKSQVDEVKRNGNGVNLDRELFKKGENAVSLNEALNIYNKSKNMLNTAIVGTGKQ